MVRRAGATPAAVAATALFISACASTPAQPSVAPEQIVAPSTSTAPSPTTSPPSTAGPTTTTADPESTPPTGPPVATHSAEVDVLAPRSVAAPVRVLIPSIGADGLVAHVGVDATGGLEIPTNAWTLVWYKHGPSPGQPGSAVIAGHLDWKGVRGTFNRLADTAVGEQVIVAYDDGSERTFTVTAVELVDKPAVSVDGTFARDGESVLRLVTCGGDFDRDARSYYSNVIVTAVPA